jgi:hypothetical protein
MDVLVIYGDRNIVIYPECREGNGKSFIIQRIEDCLFDKLGFVPPVYTAYTIEVNRKIK